MSSYPECGSAGQGNASLGRWACWRASLPECSLQTKYQWTWYSPAIEREKRENVIWHYKSK